MASFNVSLCTHPAVLVDGPESFHGDISDVAPSEKDLACGLKKKKGTKGKRLEKDEHIIDFDILNLPYEAC